MTSQYGAYALMLDKQGYIQVRACARPHARKRARAPSLARTHRPISKTSCFSSATMIRERASVLRHTYIACLVYF
jgi:hypothetical protein